jgi:CheY-like chemotaxis protein
VLARGLTRAGMTVLEAADAAAALTLARRQTPAIDILCTDCQMPGLPARQLIATFRQLNHGPVLVCSGYAPTELGLSSELFDAFLPKPFTGDQLVDAIRRAVG